MGAAQPNPQGKTLMRISSHNNARSVEDSAREFFCGRFPMLVIRFRLGIIAGPKSLQADYKWRTASSEHFANALGERVKVELKAQSPPTSGSKKGSPSGSRMLALGTRPSSCANIGESSQLARAPGSTTETPSQSQFRISLPAALSVTTSGFSMRCSWGLARTTSDNPSRKVPKSLSNGSFSPP